MTSTLRINIISNARGAVAGIRDADGALGKLGKGAAIAGAGLAAAGGLALVMGKKVYDAASQAEQAMGALDSVFGKSSDTVKQWAADAANEVGLGATKYAELASLLGSQLTNMGRSQAEAAKESKNLIGLGADLAATFGGSVADAVSAVSSTLKGETDPIERYGISIKQSDISARLAAQGLDKLTGTAAKQATATAALALITEQSTKAHGAFGRESNTAAGQAERFSANVDNLKTRLGTGLLPAATATFGFLNTKAIPALDNLAGAASRNLGPALAKVGSFLRDDVVPAARTFAGWFNDKIVPSIRGTVTPIVSGLGRAFDRVGEVLDDNSENLSKLGRFLGFVAEHAAKLGPIVGKVLGTQFKIAGETIAVVVTVISELVGGIDWAIDKLGALADKLDVVTGPIGKVGGFIGKLNPFGAAQLTTGVVSLAGRSPAFGPRPLTAAASGLGAFAGFTSSSSPGAALAGYVDARRFYTINVTGAIDPVGTARAIRDLLRADEVRSGRVATFAPLAGVS